MCKRPLTNSSGGILITLVVVMILIAILGVLMVSFLHTSTFSHLNILAASRAAYLAESGYRYAASEYKHAPDGAPDAEKAKNDKLDELDGKTFTLRDGDGEFTLRISSYFYESTEGRSEGNRNITVRFPGRMPAGFTIPSTGRLAIFGANKKYDIYDYSGWSESSGTYSFSLSNTLVQDVPIGSSVLPVCYASGDQTVTNDVNPSLTLDSQAASIFPERSGAFDLAGNATGDVKNVYIYKARVGNTLTGISVLGSPGQKYSFTVNSATPIVSHSCAIFDSTGTSMQTSSAFVRTVVLGFKVGGNSREGGTSGPSGGFVEQGDTPESFEDDWDSIGPAAPDVVTTGPSGGDPAILLKGSEGLIALNWETSNGVPDLSGAWLQQDELLSYQIQVKVNIDTEGGKGKHYMIGPSFRLESIRIDPLEFDGYGVSFFRSYGREDKDAPEWLEGDASGTGGLPASFDILMNGNPHIALWVRKDGNYTLLRSKELKVSDNVIYASGKEEGELKEWSTIVVKVDEQFLGTGDIRQNHISVYVQGVSEYPRCTADDPTCVLGWDYSGFIPLWDSQETPIVDATLTSENFYTRKPEEIGLHAFYDAPASNDQFLDDFSMGLLDAGGDSSNNPIPGM